MKRAIIFDAGTLITFSMTGMLGKIKELKDIFDGEFIITEDVKREVIDKPITIKRFELEALRVKRLLEDKVLKLPGGVGFDNKIISLKTEEILGIANNTFFGRGREIRLIHYGEASCLALSKMLTEKGINNIIAVDERTVRLLCENPENLRNLFKNKLHTEIKSKKENYNFFKGFKFIRSSELVYVAYKKGFYDLRDHDMVLDALLYAVKYNGCSISEDEIREIKNIGKVKG